MDKRIELHNFLLDLISPNAVYYQPPSTKSLEYPCIIYEMTNISSEYADSIKYKKHKVYTLTVIDRNPDSEIPAKLLDLEYCEFDRRFTNDNLNHYVFTLFYDI